MPTEVGNYSGVYIIDYNNKQANVIIGTDNFNSGVLFLNSVAGSMLTIDANNIIISASTDIGDPVALSLQINANRSGGSTGNVATTGSVVLGAGSSFALNGNMYNINSINGAASGNGTLQFANGSSTSVTTTNASSNPLDTVSVDSTNVTLLGQSINFNKLVFAKTNTKGVAPILTLVPGQTINSVTSITSSAGANIPELQFSGAAQDIPSGAVVGDANNIVRFRFMDANNPPLRFFNVNTTDFFGQITTNVDGVGGAFLNGGGKIYGLGEPDKQLASAIFFVNTINFGNTYVQNSHIFNGWTVQLGNTVTGKVTLGSASGHTFVTLNLRDQVSLGANIFTYPDSGGTSTVNFLGGATQIGNIGTQADGMKSINFNGPAGSVANFRNNSSIYATNINFGDTAINATKGNVIISGASTVNANIALGTSQLTFQNGATTPLASTWGLNTTISTNVFNATTPGSINVNTTIKVADSSNIVVTPTLASNLF